MKARILVVDDDPGFRRLLETILREAGHTVVAAGAVTEARKKGAQETFDLVLCDLKLPDGNGLQVLEWFRQNAPRTPVILITAFGTVPTAVEAMKLGAVEFLEKPLRSPDELRRLVAAALGAPARAVRVEPAPLEGREEAFACETLIFRDPAMQRVVDLALKVAPTETTVLVTGESGTGKEVLARCLHKNSRRAAQPFLVLNCAALAPTLTESALFGHERGSFTGAVAQHKGVFERADRGTLFLDEIGELEAPLQAKLLRVLQDGTLERLGGSQTLTVDVRVIAATNRDLKKMVAEGEFREDLYYRLSAFPLGIPPLRERPEDVPLLAAHFLAWAAARLGRPEPALRREATELLQTYLWPGNVRELQNMMERVAILAGDSIGPDDLPIRPEDTAPAKRWKQIERDAILEALKVNQGNRTRAAKQLGISVRTLQYRLKEYGLSSAAGEGEAE